MERIWDWAGVALAILVCAMCVLTLPAHQRRDYFIENLGVSFAGVGITYALIGFGEWLGRASVQ